MQAVREGRSISSMAMRPSLPYFYDTPEGNFRIHYDLAGHNAVDSVGYVHKMGEYLEYCWDFYIDTLGYLPPPLEDLPDGGGRHQVYLRNISAYGQVWPTGDGPQDWIDWTSYMEIDNNFNDVYPNDDPEGPVAGAMKVTCAHEFHHVIQYGLRGTSGAWIAELTSVYYEERIYPQVNDYVWLIDYLSSNPEQPLDWESGYHMYGLGIFAQYMAEAAGDEFLVSVWDTMRFMPDWQALETMSDIYYHGLDLLLANFSARALLIGSRDDGFFPDGALLSDMRVETTHRTYPASGTSTNRPYGYGMNFVVFEGIPTEDCDLEISFNGSPSASWFVRAIWKSRDSVQIFDAIDGDTTGVIVVPFANRADFVGLSIVPIGDTRTRYLYSYSADIVPANIAERPVPRDFSIRAYPNPFNASVTISIESDGAIHELPQHVEIYDLAGRRVDVIANSGQPVIARSTATRNLAQYDEISRSARNDSETVMEELAPSHKYETTWSPPEHFSSGLYFIRVGESRSLYPITLLK